MKKKQLKLNQLSEKELKKKELLNLTGGDCGSGHSGCHCGCCYEGQPGGSDSFTNLSANLQYGIVSSCSPDSVLY